MKKITVIYVLLCGLLIGACGQTPRNTFPGWDSGIDRFKEGMDGLIYYKRDKRAAAILLDFLTVNKNIYFKDEQQYLRYRGIFYFINGEIIEGMRAWRSYVAESGDYVTPRLEMFRFLGLKYSRFRHFLIDDAEQYIIRNKVKLSEYASNLIIADEGKDAFIFAGNNPAWYFDQLTIKKDISGWNRYRDYETQRLKDMFTQEDPITRSRYLISIYAFTENPEYYQWIMEQREEHAEYAVLIDNNLYNYYFARGEFERAYEIGKAYDFEKNRKNMMPGDIFDHFSGFDWKVPYIFYAVGKLEEYIPFYDTVKDGAQLKRDRQLYGSAPLEFWLAAAYGQRGEFERAFEYLKKALEKATLYNPITEVGGDIFANMEYDNLLAIIWHCYMSDAMDAFRDAGHFDKVEYMLKSRLSDFWRLEWISGWQ